MFLPRKGAPRSTSSSSIASSSSTITQPTNGAAPNNYSGDLWSTKKKGGRGLWPSSKAEAMLGVSTARPHSIASSSAGPSASSAMSAVHQPSSILPSQHMLQPQVQQNGTRSAAGQGQTESPAVLYLLPMNGTFERKTISVPFFPDVLRIGRQTNAKTLPTPMNGYFDSKVLSRQHAEIWADRNGKIWIRDVKSSNGTFVNGQRLSAENRDSEPHELREGDILELGIDIVSEDQKTVVHHKVAARVELAGFYGNGSNTIDLNFGDIDPGSGGSLITPPLSQNISQIRGRAGSQGSINSNARIGSGPPSVTGSNASVMGQQRHLNFWLTPVTMEQIVKKLTVSNTFPQNFECYNVLSHGTDRAKSRETTIYRSSKNGRVLRFSTLSEANGRKE
jgi:pSer/pThr/pTyr-binding forkhead associated (FHA) protein